MTLRERKQAVSFVQFGRIPRPRAGQPRDPDEQQDRGQDIDAALHVFSGDGDAIVMRGAHGAASASHTKAAGAMTGAQRYISRPAMAQIASAMIDPMLRRNFAVVNRR